jgi:hypothetical protein
MQKREWKIGFNAIAWIITYTAIGAYLVYRGVTSDKLLEILGGVILLLFGTGLLWGNLRAKEYYNKPVDERLTDPVYVELRTFIRETLLPLGFQEKQEDAGIGFNATYSRAELTVQLGKDVRDNYYFFQSANKLNIVKDESFNLPNHDFTIGDDAKNAESFKSKVRIMLQNWVAEQKFHNPPL